MAGPLSQIPINVHPVPKSDDTVAEQFIEQIDGETSFDQIAKAQSSMPQVVERITELENCLWALADQLTRLEPQNRQIERARLLLKNRLEIPASSEPARDGSAEKHKDGSDPLTFLWRETNTTVTHTEPESSKTTEHGDDNQS